MAPKGQSIIPDDEDPLAVDGASDGQDGKADSAVPQTASILLSSIDFTFSITGDTTVIDVVARWGQYMRAHTAPPPSAPITILHGTEDEVVPIAASREYTACYPEQVQLIEVTAGHDINDHLPLIWRLVQQFLLEQADG